MASAATLSKTSWADEIDEQVLPAPEVISDVDGVKTLVEYRFNDEGKKVKVTRRIRTKVVKEHVNRAVADRKKWAKFGAEQGAAPGPNIKSTTVGEIVYLKLSQYAAQQAKQQQEEAAEDKGITVKSSRILCRICRGEHFTAKCPYKDTLVPIEEITGAATATAGADKDAAAAAAGASAGAAAGATGGKSAYVPPHLRAGAKAAASGGDAGSSSRDRRDENPTIRISNLSEDTQEADLNQLCRPFGPLARVYMARDRDSGYCKGYAFVSYYDHESAERAIAKLNGYGFDNLILNAEWANNPK
ncbi:translation initiation factor eIF3 subunit g [Dipsacomyces acuminosporus]|nr:translation initiation factor eIF3 subunit g [Dipsacomyces acuminosporus]